MILKTIYRCFCRLHIFLRSCKVYFSDTFQIFLQTECNLQLLLRYFGLLLPLGQKVNALSPPWSMTQWIVCMIGKVLSNIAHRQGAGGLHEESVCVIFWTRIPSACRALIRLSFPLSISDSKVCLQMLTNGYVPLNFPFRLSNYINVFEEDISSSNTDL